MGDDPEIAEAAQAEETPRRPRRIVLFADGTGNGFSTQESNVWRMYRMLDKTARHEAGKGAQLAFYIPGVGTSAWAPLRVLDAITGLGVPSNVRKLYRFLCWTWQPGDTIHIFGFSRGAFTARTLAGMIHHEGLMPCEIDGKVVSTATMRRNAAGAWRHYRQKTAPGLDWREPGLGLATLRHMAPTVSVVRWLRNLSVWGKRRLLGQDLHEDVLRAAKGRGPGEVKIALLGLFDTVEAYGVPIEGLRFWISYFLWPISFRNKVCSPVVARACHALALDEERLTFAPLLFDQTPRPEAGGPAIQEVWFAGVHSDVGGGYPDDVSAYEPLIWMVDEAGKRGLRFDADQVAQYRHLRAPRAAIHDSRAGLAAFYRYRPRQVGQLGSGAPPVVHPSVLDKMAAHPDGYAPMRLEPGAQLWTKAGVAPAGLARKAGGQAGVEALILWRSLSQVAMLGAALVLATMPWLGPALAWAFTSDLPRPAPPSQTIDMLGAILPQWSKPWVTALGLFPVPMWAALVTGALFYLAGARLFDATRDVNRAAWVGQDDLQPSRIRSAAMALGRALVGLGHRLAPVHGLAQRMVTLALFIGLFVVLPAYPLLRAVIAVDLAASPVCRATGGSLLLPGQETPVRMFSPSDPCWFTGVWAVKGRTYEIALHEVEAFCDASWPAGLGGFTSGDKVFVAGQVLKRGAGAWFQPMLQVGTRKAETIPLVSVEGRALPRLDKANAPGTRTHLRVTTPFGTTEGALQPHGSCTLVPPDLVASRFVARVTPSADGPLFLYVEDAILPGLPGGRDARIWSLYANNRGLAEVRIRAEATAWPLAPD